MRLLILIPLWYWIFILAKIGPRSSKPYPKRKDRKVESSLGCFLKWGSPKSPWVSKRKWTRLGWFGGTPILANIHLVKFCQNLSFALSHSHVSSHQQPYAAGSWDPWSTDVSATHLKSPRSKPCLWHPMSWRGWCENDWRICGESGELVKSIQVKDFSSHFEGTDLKSRRIATSREFKAIHPHLCKWNPTKATVAVEEPIMYSMLFRTIKRLRDIRKNKKMKAQWCS